jgi:hypothetical protein
MKNEIILYQPNELTDHIEVRIDNEKDTICLVPSRASDSININSILELL